MSTQNQEGRHYPARSLGDGRCRRGARGVAISDQSGCARRKPRSRSAFPCRSPAPMARKPRTRSTRRSSPSPNSTTAGGLNGRKAELLVRDDKLNPGEAATRALELIEQREGEFHLRQPVGGGAARGEQRHQGTRRHLQFDQPVRHHQRGVGLQQIHLPRGAQSASDGGRGRALCVPQIRQEGRLPHRRLCLWP